MLLIGAGFLSLLTKSHIFFDFIVFILKFIVFILKCYFAYTNSNVYWKEMNSLVLLCDRINFQIQFYELLAYTVAYPGIFLGEGGSTNSVEDRENGDLWAVAP